MNYNISYVFRLVDQFSGGALAMSAAMGRISAAATRMGAALAAVAAGGAMVSMFSTALQAAAKFEDKMSEVRKVVPDMTKAGMWELGDEVMRLAAWSGVAKNEIAEIFASGARMGIRGTEALSTFAETVTKVKVAWDGVTASMAGESLATISGKFFGDMEAAAAQKRMIGVADAINYLGQNMAAVKPLELLKFFQRGGAQLSMMGFTPEEAAAYGAAAMTSGTQSGSMEGTLTRSTMQRLRTNALYTKKGQAALKALQMTPAQFGMALNARGPEAIMNLMDRLESVPTDKRGLLLKNLLGEQRATSQFENILKQLNQYKRALATTSVKWAERFLKDPKWVAWMEKTRPDQLKLLRELTPLNKTLSEGSVDQEFKARMDTLIQQTNRLSEAWSNLLVRVGKPLLPPATAFVSWLADQIASIGDYIKDNPSAARNIGIALGLSLAASITAGVRAGLMTGGGLLPRLLAGAIVTAGTLTFTILLVGAGAWIFANWESFWAAISKPIPITILWPEAPDWVKWLVGFRNQALSRNDMAERLAGTPLDGKMSNNALDRLIENKVNPADLDAVRRTIEMSDWADKLWADFQARARISADDIIKMPDPATIIRGSPRADASSVPQTMAVRVDSDVKLQPGELNVRYSGPIDGPRSVTVGGEASRGSTMGTVGGGADQMPADVR